jgi:hypothetical protein
MFTPKKFSMRAKRPTSAMDVIFRARAKITSHFKRRRILPGGVAKALNILDIPALSRLARQAPQRLKSVN